MLESPAKTGTMDLASRIMAAVRPLLPLLLVVGAMCGVIIGLSSAVVSYTRGGVRCSGASAASSLGVADATECNYTSDCVVGYLIDDTVCEPRAAKASTPCASPCFVTEPTTAHCDPAQSKCVVDDVTECLGYCVQAEGTIFDQQNACSTTDFALFSIHHYFDALFDDPNQFTNGFPEDLPLWASAECFGNACVQPMLFAQVGGVASSDPSEDFYSGALMGCLDYMNNTQGCVEAIEFRLDNDAFSRSMQLAGIGSAGSNWTGRYCFFHPSCVPLNMTKFEEVTKKRSTPLDAPTGLLLPAHQQPGLRAFPASTRMLLHRAVEGHAHKLIESEGARRRRALTNRQGK